MLLSKQTLKIISGFLNYLSNYLENVKKFKVEFAPEGQKGYDLIVQKRKEIFLVEVKSGVSFSPDQIRCLCEEADEAGYIPWLVVTDFLTDRRKRYILNLVPKPLVWDIIDIYNDILQNFDIYNDILQNFLCWEQVIRRDLISIAHNFE